MQNECVRLPRIIHETSLDGHLFFQMALEYRPNNIMIPFDYTSGGIRGMMDARPRS
jgi:hypothetical protein